MQKLINYGIQNDKSDIRFHVCPASKSVYFYQTENALKAINSTVYKEVTVKTDGVVTAKGLLVPPGDIAGMRRIPVADSAWQRLNIQQSDTPGEKKRKTEELVSKLFERGHIPFCVSATPITNLQMQCDGIDLMVAADATVQVKCDMMGGEKKYGGSGNLFMQTHEANPHKQY